MDGIERFRIQLRDYPIIAVVHGMAPLAAFLKSRSRIVFVANVDLFSLKEVSNRVSANGKLMIANLDSIPGLAPDKVGLDYLNSIGVRAVATRQTVLIPLIREVGALSFQKLYVTNRSNLLEMSHEIQASKADLVQVQPAPILGWLTEEERKALEPFIAAGFIQNAEDVRNALDNGAFAVATRSEELWNGFTK